MFDSFVLDGTVTLIAIAVLVLELVAVIARTLSGCRRPVFDLVANAVSGLFLILALRAALLGSGASIIACFLALAFVAHVAGLAKRLNELGGLREDACVNPRSDMISRNPSTLTERSSR